MKIVESEKEIFELLGFPYVGHLSASVLSNQRANFQELIYSSSLRSENFQFGKGSLEKLVSLSKVLSFARGASSLRRLRSCSSTLAGIRGLDTLHRL